MSRLTRLLQLLALLVPATASAQSLDDVVAQTLSPWIPGVVVAVRQAGQTQFLQAFGHRAAEPDSALATSDVFPFLDLSEVLVGVMVGALDSAGVVDEDAPLSTYMPSLSSLVGRATLRELLTNTAGLDDAARIQGESWKRTLDRIDDKALVAEPGAFYSESRHSLPLAVRVIETVTKHPFDELASVAILRPLGMTSSTFSVAVAHAEGLVRGVQRVPDPSTPTKLTEPADTVEGLPVLFTTAPDVLRFLSAWMDGSVRGPGPADVPSVALPSDSEGRRGAGVRISEYRGQTLVMGASPASGLGTSAEFYLLPRSDATIFIWSVGEWPRPVGAFTVGRLADALHAPPPAPPSSSEPAGAALPAPAPAEWAGTYRNGDRIFELRDSTGALVMFDGARDLSLTAEGPKTMAAHVPDGRVALRFELLKDASGRRYLYYGDLAYRDEDDPIGR